MKKIELLKGNVASGKTSYAKEKVNKNPDKWINICKDDIREMLHDSKFSSKREKRVLHVRNNLIKQFMEEGMNVIVSDTNLHPKHEEHMKELIKWFSINHPDKEQYELVVNDSFTDVPVDECIKRDLKRDRTVGEKVILDFHYKYIHEEDTYPVDPELPTCIICDIDGTIAKRGDRSPFHWKRVGEDEPILDIIDLVNTLYFAEFVDEVIFFSGRDGECFEETLEWLEKYIQFSVGYLYMRKEGDNRKDTIVKEEMFEHFVRGKYNVKFVLDDRRQVVDMWRGLGLKCLEVADHRF